MELLHSD